jgi:hypothetical protein
MRRSSSPMTCCKGSQPGGRNLGRFIVNTTIGVGGIVDVATKAGIPYHTNDLGITLATWGIDSGPYLMLPVLGPSNPRDLFGDVADSFGDPGNIVASNHNKLWTTFARRDLGHRRALAQYRKPCRDRAYLARLLCDDPLAGAPAPRRANPPSEGRRPERDAAARREHLAAAGAAQDRRRAADPGDVVSDGIAAIAAQLARRSAKIVDDPVHRSRALM